MKKRKQDAWCYEFRQHLPEGLDHACYSTETSDKFSTNKLHNPRRIAKVLAYPDPPVPIFAIVRGWLQHHNPRFFQEGAIKETLKIQKSQFMACRNDALKDYCKKHNRRASSFPPPIEPDKPIFAPFGPSDTWLDKIERKIRQQGLSVGLAIRGFCITILAMTLPLLFFLSAAPQDKFLLLIIASVFIGLTEILARFSDCMSTIRKVTSEPVIVVIEQGKVSQLLRNLKDIQRELMHYFPGAMTCIHRSRPHPNKNGYSLKIVSLVMLNKLVSPLFVDPEFLTLHIEIVGESVNSSPIFCYWFDTPKTILTAKRSLALVNLVKDRLRGMLKGMDEHLTVVFLTNTTDVNAKVEISYGPFVLTI